MQCFCLDILFTGLNTESAYLCIFLTENTTIPNINEVKENMTMGTTLVVNPDGSGFLVGNICRCVLHCYFSHCLLIVPDHRLFKSLHKKLYGNTLFLLPVNVYNYKTANDMLAVCLCLGFFYDWTNCLQSVIAVHKKFRFSRGQTIL